VPYAEWLARVTGAGANAARHSAISASSLEDGAAPEGVAAVDQTAGLEKGVRNLELPPWNKGRYGSAIGRAVHGALQTTDLATGAGLDTVVGAQALAEGVVDYQDLVLQLCWVAIAAPTIQRAATRRHWRETYVGTTLDDGRILEGFLDLVFEDDDGSLVVVDYKTDDVPTAALPARVQVYLPQMAAYAQALERSTGRRVSMAVLIFLDPSGATEQVLLERQLTWNLLAAEPADEIQANSALFHPQPKLMPATD